MSGPHVGVLFGGLMSGPDVGGSCPGLMWGAPAREAHRPHPRGRDRDVNAWTRIEQVELTTAHAAPSD